MSEPAPFLSALFPPHDTITRLQLGLPANPGGPHFLAAPPPAALPSRSAPGAGRAMLGAAPHLAGCRGRPSPAHPGPSRWRRGGGRSRWRWGPHLTSAGAAMATPSSAAPGRRSGRRKQQPRPLAPAIRPPGGATAGAEQPGGRAGSDKREGKEGGSGFRACPARSPCQIARTAVRVVGIHPKSIGYQRISSAGEETLGQDSSGPVLRGEAVPGVLSLRPALAAVTAPWHAGAARWNSPVVVHLSSWSTRSQRHMGRDSHDHFDLCNHFSTPIICSRFMP